MYEWTQTNKPDLLWITGELGMDDDMGRTNEVAKLRPF